MPAKIQKIRYLTKTVNPYGGVLFCINEIEKKGIHTVIDKALGKRVKQAKYKYSDVVLSWVYSILCGSKRLEDVKKLKPYFDDIHESKHPSPDRIGGIFKNFATDNIQYVIEKGKMAGINSLEYNVNIPMNQILLNVGIKLGFLKPNTGAYTLDYDNVIIPCEKSDAEWSYKRCQGYCPGVATIGKIPVYMEMRGGNANAAHKMEDTLTRMLDFLEASKIKIKTFRSDAAAYSKSIVSLMDKRGIEFVIRADKNKAAYDDIRDYGIWEEVEIGDIKHEISSTDNYNFAGKNYRLVITRKINPDNDKNKFDSDSVEYRSIITNNYTMSDQEIVNFYNQRGDSENNFRDLLNDWNWKRLPFSYMNQNHVFMALSAIGYVIYRHLIITFSKKLPFLRNTFKLKKFVDNFITLALEWIIEGEEKIPLLNTNRDYTPLYGRPPSE